MFTFGRRSALLDEAVHQIADDEPESVEFDQTEGRRTPAGLVEVDRHQAVDQVAQMERKAATDR